MAQLDIVVVNFRTEGALPGLLRNLEGLSRRDVSVDVTIVDCSGMSDDARRGLLESSGINVAILDPGRNLGFAAGANVGGAQGHAPVLLFVNPDVELHPDRLADLFVDGAALGVPLWTGILMNADGTVQRNTSPRPSLLRFALEYLGGIDTRLGPGETAREVGVVTGALVFVRREAFDAAGGFDESYPLYVEDVDWSQRVGRLGRLVQLPIVVGTHIGGEGARHAPTETWVLLHASRVAYFRRRSRVAGTVARALVVSGCGMRSLLGRGRTEADLRALVRATRRGFPLATLLPSRDGPARSRPNDSPASKT